MPDNFASEKVDVAVNIFAKPWQTALSILSLLDKSGQHVGKIWLQFEPMGSKFDKISPYVIAEYLDYIDMDFIAFQPKKWLAREAATPEMIADEEQRQNIRYQCAFEHSSAKLLFIMHNDIFALKDVIGHLKTNIGDAFAIGSIGQCWNCPASNAGITQEIMKRSACNPDSYMEFRPDRKELYELYQEAARRGIFARPYAGDKFNDEFRDRPWPLPECRVNEWACLINLHISRPATLPFGSAWPPGAFRLCSGHNLDVFGPWFRDMHNQGFKAKNCDIYPFIRHWVGTGNKSPLKYAFSEDRAKNLLEKFYPDFIAWLNNR